MSSTTSTSNYNALSTPLKTNAGKNAKRSLYINTLVFSIIAALISVSLLVLIFFVAGARGFIYAIVTTEVGLIAVIIAAIVRIYMYERKLKKEADQGNSVIVNIDTCPDYFSSVFNDASSVQSTDTIVNLQAVNIKSLPFCRYNPDRFTIVCDNTDNNNLKPEDNYVMVTISSYNNEIVVALRNIGNGRYITVATDLSVSCSSDSTQETNTHFRKKPGSSANRVKLQSVSTGQYLKVVETNGVDLGKIVCNPNADTEFIWTSRQPTSAELDVGKGIQCKNGYVDLANNVKYVFVKRGCLDYDPNSEACSLETNKPATEHVVNLTNYNQTSVRDICSRVNNRLNVNNVFNNIPWTDVKARCDNLRLP